MHTPHPTLHELATFLQNELSVDRYPDREQGGIYQLSDRPVQRLGLALDPFAGLPEWAAETHIDALWLHRPWQLNLEEWPRDIGILSHHLPFDESLTVGFNEHLARQLGATPPLEPLGYKQAADDNGKLLPQRPLGMLFDVPGQEFDDLLDTLKTLFGGYDRAEAGFGTGSWQADSRRIAAVGAMTDALVREAVGRGAQLYLTGAYRKPAQPAVDQTGIAVVAVGHRRVEAWGMRVLADLLHERWGIDCLIHE
ncbi:Nif3-like dinuclear metal center hexameric protein [Spirosoma koreense]